MFSSTPNGISYSLGIFTMGEGLLSLGKNIRENKKSRKPKIKPTKEARTHRDRVEIYGPVVPGREANEYSNMPNRIEAQTTVTVEATKDCRSNRKASHGVSAISGKRILSCSSIIAKNVNPSEINRRLIFIEDHDRISAIAKSDPRLAMHELIKEVVKKGKEKDFIVTLEACGYIRVLNFIRNYENMDQEYQKIHLQRVCHRLRDMISVPALLLYLEKEELISEEERQNIFQKMQQEGQIAAADVLLDKVTRRHQMWYFKLIECLESSGQSDAADILNGEIEKDICKPNILCKRPVPVPRKTLQKPSSPAPTLPPRKERPSSPHVHPQGKDDEISETSDDEEGLEQNRPEIITRDRAISRCETEYTGCERQCSDFSGVENRNKLKATFEAEKERCYALLEEPSPKAPAFSPKKDSDYPGTSDDEEGLEQNRSKHSREESTITRFEMENTESEGQCSDFPGEDQISAIDDEIISLQCKIADMEELRKKIEKRNKLRAMLEAENERCYALLKASNTEDVHHAETSTHVTAALRQTFHPLCTGCCQCTSQRFMPCNTASMFDFNTGKRPCSFPDLSLPYGIGTLPSRLW